MGAASILVGSDQIVSPSPGAALQLPYNTPNVALNWRLLFHETLGEQLRYPEIPRQTLGFDGDALDLPGVSVRKGLKASVSARFEAIRSDAFVTEVWTGGATILAGFWHELYRFWRAPLADGDQVIWWPRDQTDKAYVVEQVMLGPPGEEEGPNVRPISEWGNKDRRWLTEEVRHRMRILEPFEKPTSVIFLEGA